jgi:hypothetical protein
MLETAVRTKYKRALGHLDESLAFLNEGGGQVTVVDGPELICANDARRITTRAGGVITSSTSTDPKKEDRAQSSAAHPRLLRRSSAPLSPTL